MATEPGYDQRNLMLTHTLSYNGDNPQLQAEYLYDGDGHRVRQTDYTGETPVTMTSINDVAGLAQVLVMTDGETQTTNLFGLGPSAGSGQALIGQDDGRGFRTLLADGLGSVRSEVVNGEVMATMTYDPFGTILDERGHNSTTYGYTGEQFDDVTGLLYLRARYYNPGLHTFMGKDPWSGNPGKPQSMNGWSYVDNNPINWTDPTGRTPFRAQHCIEAGFFYPEDYGNCVRQVYGLTSGILLQIQNSDYGYPFHGGPWCWYGPVPYRASGYLEGASGTGSIFAGVTGGAEIVYDFATMQRQEFWYYGSVLQDSVGLTGGAYLGSVQGLRTTYFGQDKKVNIFDDYSGAFVLSGGGVSTDLGGGPSIGAGAILFASPTDPNIYGMSFYVSAGLTIDPLLIVDGVIGLAIYYPVDDPFNYYAKGLTPVIDKVRVDESRIRGDILNGVDSPWTLNPSPQILEPLVETLRHVLIMDEVTRMVDAFNQIHFESYLEP